MRPFDSFFLPFAIVLGVGGGVVLLVQFLSLRVRNAGLSADERDPHLGRKFVLGVFLHLSVLLLLVGLTVLSVDLFEELINGSGNSWGTPATMQMGGGPGGGPWGPPPPPPAPVAKPFPNGAQRIAFGLMLSGVMHGVLFGMLLYFATNARKFPAVSRALVLNRLVAAGLILMGITTTFCLYLFSEGSTGGPVDNPFGRIIGTAVVWAPAAVAHLCWLLFALTTNKPKGSRVVEVTRPPEPTDDDRPRRRRPADD